MPLQICPAPQVVAPQRHSPAPLQLAGGAQAAQALAVPHAIAVCAANGTHCGPEQQPWQIDAEHSHAPATQISPCGQTPGPHRHRPRTHTFASVPSQVVSAQVKSPPSMATAQVPITHVAVAGHAAHEAPSKPQASLVSPD
jgi:hypothetical protein